MTKKEFFRRAAAWMLPFLPLAAYPALFAGIAAPRYFSDIRCITPEIFGVFCLAALVAFPERTAAVFRQQNFTVRLWGGTALFIFAAETIRFFAGGASGKFLLALFYTALPLAAIAWGRFFRENAVKIAGVYGILAIFYALCSPGGEGLMLNWNWNATLIVLSLPCFGMFLFPQNGKRAFFCTLLLIAVDLAFSLVFRRDYFSLGTWCAAFCAGIALLLTETCSPRMLRRIVLPGAGIFFIAFFLLVPQGKNQESYRIQLWRGTRELILAEGLFGVGMGNFEDRIVEKLPPEIRSTPFPANRHLHPHNEMLFFLAVSGIAGAAFFLLLVLAVTEEKKTHTPQEKFLLWGFFILLFHGGVDVLLGETPTAALFYFFAGALIGGNSAVAPRPSGHRTVAALLIFLSGIALAVRETAATVHYRRAHEAFFKDAGTCRAELQKSLVWKIDAPALYLAGCDAIRQHRFAEAEMFFTKLHRKLDLGGYIHSNHFAGRAALMRHDYAGALAFFVREEMRFPDSIVNAFWMARLAENAGYPENLRLETEREIDRRLALRGKDRRDLPDFLLHPEKDDLLKFVKTPTPAPEPQSMPRGAAH